jgi:hypothetical protein
LAGKQQLPAGIPDPASLHSRDGALAAYQGVLTAFQTRSTSTTNTNGAVSTTTVEGVLVSFVLTSGLLTDELQSGNLGGNPLNYRNIEGLKLDTRQLAEGIANLKTDNLYTSLQGIRNAAHLAIAALATYDTVDSPALRGHLYALAGYSELFLADLYCSGVPLSTLDFNGDFTYHAGSTTDELYQAAIAQFDTALALSGDSVRFLQLARVGKGRAYLALGQYDLAAAAVASVPTTYTYQLPINWNSPDITDKGGLFSTSGVVQGGVTVANTQGGTGLPYRSSGDPRTASQTWGNNTFGLPQYAPVAYGGAALAVAGGSVIKPLVMASGIEARLIEAETALKAGNASWLTILNTLRTAGASTTETFLDTLGITQCGGAFAICGDPGPDFLGGSTPEHGQPAGGFPGYTFVSADTTYPAPDGILEQCYDNSYYIPCYAGDSMVVLTYTRPAPLHWEVGTGGVSGLDTLGDPGDSPRDTARIKLLFRERAYWLFLAGHRQGDLRRLIRHYGLSQSEVYPTGGYPSLSGLFPQYGTDVNAPVPTEEHINPKFAGCQSRGA